MSIIGKTDSFTTIRILCPDSADNVTAKGTLQSQIACCDAAAKWVGYKHLPNYPPAESASWPAARSRICPADKLASDMA
jgi:hypothetical protein